MSKTNDNKQPVAVENMQPQAPPPPNEVFIRVGTTLYKVVDQPTLTNSITTTLWCRSHTFHCNAFVNEDLTDIKLTVFSLAIILSFPVSDS